MKASLSLLFISGIASVLAELNESPKLLHVPFTKKIIHSKLSPLFNKRDGTYTAPLYNVEYGYLINISIGTPAQNFQLAADTGSSDVWIAGSECPETICPVTRFIESSSSTYKTNNIIFNFTYAKGQASGMYATDTFTIGGATIADQQFGIATNTSDIFLNRTISSSTDPSFDNATTTPALVEGIFGLAYPGLTYTEKPYNPFFFNLIDQKIISNPIFSIFLNRSEDLGNSGQIIFGGEDNTKHTGDVQYFPVTDTLYPSFMNRSEIYGYWSVYTQGFGALNGSKEHTNIEANKVFRIVVDTGSTLTYIPKKALSLFISKNIGSENVAYDQVENTYQIRCSMADSDVIFQVQLTDSLEKSDNPTVLNIPLRDMIFPLDTDSVSTASACMFGLAPNDDTILLGDSVLRSFYLVFDAGQNRIGFAPAIGSNATITGNVRSGDNTSLSTSTSSNNTLSKNQSNSSDAMHLQPCILMSLMLFIALLF